MKFLCELLFGCLAVSTAAKPIDELTYGTVLYDYYQQDFQGALLSTLVADEQRRTGENTVRFDLARGSFAFSDGMYDYARATFDAIAQEELTNLDRQRLAFHLAREYHRRGDWTELAAQLKQIDLGKTWLGRERTHPEVEYMRAEVAVQQGAFAQAQQALERIPVENSLYSYGLFNLGIAQREQNDLVGASATFTTLAELPAYDEEALDLTQRARLALSYVARAQSQMRDAEAVLNALPGAGRYRDIALASYGNLSMDRDDYELSARIWLTLQKQDYWNASTAAARLGFPASLEKLSSTAAALAQYQVAERSFEARLVSLEQLESKTTDREWLTGFLSVFADPEQDRDTLQAAMQSFEDELGHTDWLEWLSTEEVNTLVGEWRELKDIESYLGALPPQLDALAQVAQEQRNRAQKANALLYEDQLLEHRDDLKLRADGLAEQLAVLRGTQPEPSLPWFQSLATQAEMATLSELLSARESVLNKMPKRDHPKWLARVDRMIGVYFYQIVDELSTRTQALAKQHRELGVIQGDLEERIARVKAAEESFVAGVETDFGVFLTRADQISDQVAYALDTREELLAAAFRSRMNDERRRVEEYLLVTRIAIARTTDQLALSADAPLQQGGS